MFNIQQSALPAAFFRTVSLSVRIIHRVVIDFKQVMFFSCISHWYQRVNLLLKNSNLEDISQNFNAIYVRFLGGIKLVIVSHRIKTRTRDASKKACLDFGRDSLLSLSVLYEPRSKQCLPEFQTSRIHAWIHCILNLNYYFRHNSLGSLGRYFAPSNIYLAVSFPPDYFTRFQIENTKIPI